MNSSSICRQLPHDVRQHIRSNTAMSTVVHCVEELVLNSLDAGANSISIDVNLSTFRIKVDDTGYGIGTSDLSLIGTRYTTSKCTSLSDLQNPRYYGYRGEALANILQFSSSIEIYTRQDSSVYTRKLKGDDSSGAIMKVSHAKKPTKGTTVVVNKFLSKAVVRQKRLDPVLELEEIKSRVEAIALINPRVTFVLKNDEKNCKLLNINATVSTKDVFRQLYGYKYGMGGHVLVEVSNQYDVFFFSAFVSSQLTQTKSYQNFYVNKRLVGRCHFSRLLNDMLREYLGSKSELGKSRDDSKLGGWRGGADGDGGKKKYPVFIVNVQCPVEEYDITFEPRKQMIEFRRKKVLIEAADSLVKRLKAVITSENRHDERNVVEKRISDKSYLNEIGIGKTITTHAIGRAVHSRAAIREGRKVQLMDEGQKRTSKLFQNIRDNFAPFRLENNSRKKLIGKNSPSPVPKRRRQDSSPEVERKQRKVVGRKSQIADACSSVASQLTHMSVSTSTSGHSIQSLSEVSMVDVNSDDDADAVGCSHHDTKYCSPPEKMSQETKSCQTEETAFCSNTPNSENSHSLHRRNSPTSQTRFKTPIDQTSVVEEHVLPKTRDEYFAYNAVALKLIEIKSMMNFKSYKTRLQQLVRELAPAEVLENVLSKKAKSTNLEPFLKSNHFEVQPQRPNISNSNVESFVLQNHFEVQPQRPSISNSNVESFVQQNHFEVQPQRPSICNSNVESFVQQNHFEVQPQRPNICNSNVESFVLQNHFEVQPQRPNICNSNVESFVQQNHLDVQPQRPNTRNSNLEPFLKSHHFDVQPQRPNIHSNVEPFVQQNHLDVQPQRPNNENFGSIIEDRGNWEASLDCQIVSDSKGQDWLETENAATGQLNYVNLNQKRANVPIISNTKLTAAQIALLNQNRTKPSFSMQFQGVQRDFLDNQRTRTLSKNGQIELIISGQTCLSNSVKEYIDGINSGADLPDNKWRFPGEAIVGGSETYVAGNGSSTHFSEYWERPIGSTQIPLRNLASSELNFCWTSSNKNFMFKKEDLVNVQVIGQIDNKFIAGQVYVRREGESMKVIVLFDQHAVHERIRLEELLRDVYEDDPASEGASKTKYIATVVVRPPINLNFSDTEIRVLKRYKTELQVCGVYAELMEFNNSINVTRIPKCFAEKISNEAMMTRDETAKKLTYSLIQEQLSYILDTKQQNRGVPKTIFNLLCSQACHGAIKFGDHLSTEACQDLIHSLENCQLPFQCAHGRPSLVPLLNL